MRPAWNRVSSENSDYHFRLSLVNQITISKLLNFTILFTRDLNSEPFAHETMNLLSAPKHWSYLKVYGVIWKMKHHSFADSHRSSLKYMNRGRYLSNFLWFLKKKVHVQFKFCRFTERYLPFYIRCKLFLWESMN